MAAPTRFLEDRITALALHAARFLSADLVNRLVHIGDDVEAVEDLALEILDHRLYISL